MYCLNKEEFDNYNILIKKRYLVFIYQDYYPIGGCNDLVATFSNLQDVKTFIKKQKLIKNLDIVDVYDLLLGDTIYIKTSTK